MKIRLLAFALLAGVSVNASAVTTNFSFTGTFSADDDVQFFNFTADGASTVTLRSYSYAGGVQADGNIVIAGGFDPILAVFDSVGNLVDQQDDADEDGIIVPTDPNTGEAYDTELPVMLAAGDYTVSIMQYNNFANGPTLGDGFLEAGNPFFTSQGGCSNGQFCDDTEISPFNNRTNQWAFDILNVESAEIVPVPAAAWLFGSALGLLGWLKRKAI